MSSLCVIFLLVLFIDFGQCLFNTTTAADCRRKMDTDKKKLNELCGVVVSYVKCGIQTSFTSSPNTSELAVFEKMLSEIEGESPCNYNLRDIADDIWNKTNIDRSVFDWDREAKCRKRLQNYIDGDYDFQTLCPDLIYYATCVIKTAFLRRPTKDELQSAMDEFKKNAKKSDVPNCVNIDTLVNITKEIWLYNTNDILKDNQGGYVPPDEIDCRDKFWSSFKNGTLSGTNDLLLTYMSCVIQHVFRSKPSPEELTTMEDVLIQPTETAGRQILLIYDLQAIADKIWGSAHMLRASVVLCIVSFILLKCIL